MWRGVSRVSGSVVGKIAIKTFVCNGCEQQYRSKAPPQCLSCGRMDFTKFDSVGEAGGWAGLRMQERAGLIRNLQRQVWFDLNAMRPDGTKQKAASYVADYVFEERDGDDWKWVIGDWKGAIDDVAVLKLKWMAAQGMPVRIYTNKGIMKRHLQKSAIIKKAMKT